MTENDRGFRFRCQILLEIFGQIFGEYQRFWQEIHTREGKLLKNAIKTVEEEVSETRVFEIKVPPCRISSFKFEFCSIVVKFKVTRHKLMITHYKLIIIEINQVEKIAV